MKEKIKKFEKKLMFWIGLYLDGSMVKWAKITQNKKKISIDLLRTFPFSEEKAFFFPQSGIEECSYKLISGLETSEVLLRNLQIKQKDRKKILKLLPFQIEPQLPWSSEDAIISIQIAPGDSPKSSKISFYATKKDTLQSHIELLKQKNADPDETSCTPNALWRFAQQFFPDLSDTIILHVGSKTSTIVGITNSKPSFSHSFSLGSELFSTALESEKPDPSFPNFLSISAEKTPILHELTEQAKKELDRVFTFFLKKQKDPWKNIILTGNFSAGPLLKAFIAHHLPDSMKLHECQGNESYDGMTLESYAIPIGLALDGLLQDGLSTRFRKETFTSSSQKKEYVKLFSSFALACLVLTSSTILISNMYRNHNKKKSIEVFQNSFSIQQKTINTLEDLKKEIVLKEESLNKEKTPYQLALPMPNVSEVLAWLSSHPVLTSTLLSEKGDEVDIKKVKYTLVRYPKITTPTLPYVGKIELEVEISNMKLAKNFQSSIQKEISFIDLKKEISWEAKGSTYFISFFLKPYLVGGDS